MLLVTGASGFLGGTVAAEALASGRAVVGAVHQHTVEQPGLRAVAIDLTAPSAAKELVERLQPEWVINCAGFTNVDDCERDPERARLLNVELPKNLAGACADAGSGLVHISTDSVFDGARGGYREDDEPSPVNVYAQSKLEGELAVQEALPDALIVRTNFIGVSPSRSVGLADWISSRLESGERIKGFTDVIFAPILTNELARLVLGAMDTRLKGLYHATARNTMSKFDFAVSLATALGFDADLVERVSLAESNLIARRPLNTSLSSLRLETALRRMMPTVQNAIDGYAMLHSAGYASQP
jgi:dTDP-4-dehydrorhamnose reductase